MKRNLFTQGLLLISIINFGMSDPSQKEYEGYQPQKPPIPFAFSIVGSSNPNTNLFYNRTTNFHISLFSGNVRSVQGLQVGAVSNFVRSDFFGYDATGIYSQVGGNFSGSQASGIIGNVKGNFFGLQTAGVVNRVGGDFFGLQSSGIVNVVEGDFTGIQVSGVTNQAANVNFLQIAGVKNESKDVEGVQISGVINKADHVRGVQIGLINKSKKLDGIAIGLINLSEAGSVHLVSWGTSPENIQAGIKFAPNDYWYTILSLGNTSGLDDTKALRAFQGRMGIHLDLVQRLFVEMDLGGGNSIPNNFSNLDHASDYHSVIEARLSMGYKIGSRLSVVGGVSNTKIGDDVSWLHQDKGEIKPFFGIQI